MTDFSAAFEDAKKHARQVYPEESCGFIIGGKYLPITNAAADPSLHVADDPACPCRLCRFRIPDAIYLEHEKNLEMVIHSHPDRPAAPTRLDMQSQASMGVAWGIISLDGERISEPLVWGGMTPIKPILGREFVHGVSDCYSLVRDTFFLGKEELALQGIDWPFPSITLPEVPRDDSWWTLDFDLYATETFKNGFVEIPREQVQPGDGFLACIRSTKMNHAGLLLSNDLILHHLPQRLSRREPAGLWARQAVKWVRYVGQS